jgi:hypothetical protein
LGRVHPSSVTVALGNIGKRGPHHRTLDRLRRYGANTLMRALDRATAPPPTIVEDALQPSAVEDDESDGPADWWLELHGQAAE